MVVAVVLKVMASFLLLYDKLPGEEREVHALFPFPV